MIYVEAKKKKISQVCGFTSSLEDILNLEATVVFTSCSSALLFFKKFYEMLVLIAELI